jgi:hypothetical protein
MWTSREEQWLREHHGKWSWPMLADLFRREFKMVRTIPSMSSKFQELRKSAANGSLKKRKNRKWTSDEDDWLATQKTTTEFSWQNLADAYAVQFPHLPKRTVKALKHRKDFLFQRAHSAQAHAQKDT